MRVMYGCIAAILIGFTPTVSSAFSLEPMTAILTPWGAGRALTFRIKNQEAERVALRFRVVTRSIGPEEQEFNTPADELFVVQPMRLFLERGATASATVQWKGPEKVDLERSYRLIAEKFPQDAISVGDGDSGVGLVDSFSASLYVGSPIFTPELLVFVPGSLGPNGGKGYSVEIRNVGRRHVIAAGARVVITHPSAPPLSSEELKHLSGTNYLPGMSRRIFIPRSEASVGRAYEAKVEYAKTY